MVPTRYLDMGGYSVHETPRAMLSEVALMGQMEMEIARFVAQAAAWACAALTAVLMCMPRCSVCIQGVQDAHLKPPLHGYEWAHLDNSWFGMHVQPPILRHGCEEKWLVVSR